MKEFKIKIGKKSYKFKNTIRSLFMFEAITKKTFSIDSVLDNYVFIYCILMASNQDDFDLTWDQFLDELDKDPNIFIQLSQELARQNKADEVFSKGEEKEGTDKKKT